MAEAIKIIRVSEFFNCQNIIRGSLLNCGGLLLLFNSQHHQRVGERNCEHI